MKKQFAFLAVAILGLATPGLAQPDPTRSAQDAPPITWTQPATNIKVEGEATETSYEFEGKNTSDQTVIITEVARSCGCQSVEQSAQIVEPGEKITLKGKIALQPYHGVQTKQLTVLTDPGPPQQLTVTITAPKKIRETPENPELRKDGAARQTTVATVPPGKTGGRLGAVALQHGGFMIKSEKKTGDSKNKHSTLVNFNSKGLQTTRFDAMAAAIDAHDGEIALFDGIYYLYGTSYDCGYEWGNKSAPFCGFKSYSSKDLVNWTDKGFLFDAQTEIWQTRCNGKTYGCYRPHVIFNKKTGLYVLWINVYDNRSGFRVFTSPGPAGPFTEIAEPVLAVNSDAPIAGLNNGDHDTFIDDDGTAYIAFTDWRTNGTIVIEKLNDDYTSGTGEHVKAVTSGRTEAPGLMKRKEKYYVLYSDPNCGYCAGTGTSYKTAPSPLGPWSEGIKINENSCGGQPSFVSTFKLKSETVFLYGSDLWNHGAPNEALANYYWAPLTFAADGSINPIVCQDTVTVPIEPDAAPEQVPADADSTSGSAGFTTYSDIGGNIQRSQSFLASRSGKLTEVDFTSSKSGHPDAGLIIEIYPANDKYQPEGKVLSSILVSADEIGWSPKYVKVRPDIPVLANKRYAIVVKSTSSVGRYGFQYSDSAPYPGGGAAYSSDNGESFSAEENRTLMFKTSIRQN